MIYFAPRAENAKGKSNDSEPCGLAEFAPAGANPFKSMFGGGVYVAEHSARVALTPFRKHAGGMFFGGRGTK